MTISTVIIESTGMTAGSTSVGTLDAMTRLKNAGLRLILVAEANGGAKARTDIEAFLAENERLIRQLADMGVRPDGVAFCPHEPASDCACRPPRSGLFEDVMRRWHLDARECRFIGTTATAIKAARAVEVGALAVHVQSLGSESGYGDIPRFEDIPAAAAYIMQSANTEAR